MTDWNGQTDFELDKLGQIKEVNDHDGYITGYRYDPVGNIDLMTYPDKSVAGYAFDLLDRMTKLTDNEKQETVYTYDSVRLTGMAYPNGWKESYSYDGLGQLLSSVATDPTNTPSKAITDSFTYDPNGNIVTENRSGGTAWINKASPIPTIN